MADLTIKRERLIELVDQAAQFATPSDRARLLSTAVTTGAIQIATDGSHEQRGDGGPGCITQQALGRVDYSIACRLDEAIQREIPGAGRGEAPVYPVIKVVD